MIKKAIIIVYLFCGVNLSSGLSIACDANSLGDLITVGIRHKTIKDFTPYLDEYFNEIEGNIKREKRETPQQAQEQQPITQEKQDPAYWDKLIRKIFDHIKGFKGNDFITNETTDALVKGFNELSKNYSHEALDSGFSIILDKLG